jgi:hypothetical protein
LSTPIDEQHARRDVRRWQDLVSEANRLEHTHDLGIEMHCARQVVGGRLALDDHGRDAVLSQQIG